MNALFRPLFGPFRDFPNFVDTMRSSVGLVMIATAHASVLTPSAIGTTYRALVAGSVGDSFRSVAKVVELPIPTLAEGEVLVKVVYAGVNGGCETFRARGEFAFVGNKEAADGFALGAEGVGVVAAIGDGVENVVVGDAVCFVGSGFAEYTKAKAQMLWKVPQPTAEMAALRISALTACAMIELTGKVRQSHPHTHPQSSDRSTRGLGLLKGAILPNSLPGEGRRDRSRHGGGGRRRPLRGAVREDVRVHGHRDLLQRREGQGPLRPRVRPRHQLSLRHALP